MRLFFDESYCMTQEGTKEYIATVRQLQEKYRDQIEILLGVEQDYHSLESTEPYDYVIGSVHYVEKDGHYLAVDDSKETQQENVAKFYGGDYYSFAEDYYATVADVYRKTRCHIIGHFDLITKFNEKRDLFDPQHPRYRAAAQKALEALLSCPATLEVNTSMVVRGKATEPYPAKEILSQWQAAGKPVLYSDDCHDKTKLLAGYPVYLAHIGAKEKE